MTRSGHEVDDEWGGSDQNVERGAPLERETLRSIALDLIAVRYFLC